MKNILFLALFLVSLVSCTPPMEEADPVLPNIVGHWIENPDLSTDTELWLVPFDPDSDIPYHLKFGGIEFFDDGTALQYYWLKCGNDPHAPATPGNYTIMQPSDETDLLFVEFPDVNAIEYEVLEVTSDHLKLRRI